MTRVTLTINGAATEADVPPRKHLADFLREDLTLTGTHIGCEHGICGACTVEIDGEIARSCITYAVTCDGASIRTIESFDADQMMMRLRRAFSQSHALQCGYCTPGMLIAARDLIRRRGSITREEIRREMSGNLCRCTGYMGIVTAIETVMAEAGTSPKVEPCPLRGWLGPAPGPAREAEAATKASRGPSRERTKPDPVPQPRDQRVQGGERSKSQIRIESAPAEIAEGRTRLRQSFVLQQSLDAAWPLFRDPLQIARCMPGLSIEMTDKSNEFHGRMDVALGPISTSFAGEGHVTLFEAAHRQVIEGHGADRKTGSRAAATIDYSLQPIKDQSGTDATRVDVAIDYTLSGPLAQFGRSGLIQDLVRRIAQIFAENAAAKLAGADISQTTAEPLHAGAILWPLLKSRWQALLARLGLR